MKAKQVYPLLFALIAAPQLLFSQVELQPVSNEPLPFFYLDMVNSRSQRPEKSALQVYVKVPYDELRYIKASSDSFAASYDVAVAVYDKDDFQTDGREWEERIVVPTFDETQSRATYSYSTAAFDLDPGEYKITVSVTDRESHATMSQKTNVVIRDFSKEKISISDVLFADSVKVDPGGAIETFPQVNTPRRRLGSLYGFFYIYSLENYGPYTVDITIRNAQNKKVFQDSRDFRRLGSQTPVVFAIPDSQLSHGGYALELRARAGDEKAELETHFAIHWEGVPVSAKDLDAALEQLRYISEGKDLKGLKDASEESKRMAFLKFWRRRDPTPGTERNELMDEYYRRVQYANTHFRGARREGWRTDMGMVYILLGPPNDVERQPFTRTYLTTFSGRPVKAYEVWRYHDLNRTFVFVDETGFGEFHLDNPGALDDLYRQYR